MKRYNIYGIFSLLALSAVTSCLSEGGQIVSLNGYPGVVQKRNDSTKIYLKGNDIIYSPQTNVSVDHGDCVMIDFTLDYSKPENSDSGRVKGFLTVDISNVLPVSAYPLHNVPTDTSVVLANEHTISSVQQRNAFILNRFFLYTEHRSDMLPLHLDLSYNPNQTLTDKTYELFLRVTKDTEATPAAQLQVQCHTFDLTELSGRETDSLIFRIHYVQGFNKDSTQMTWSSTPVYRFPL
ncbi:MAG: hypothetical protein LBB84_11185 [Tannerellaceae bacterium]|jgi:hypothetical protein|nr:hypothetical protein [Tannerellaceae bacterium]